MTPALKVIMSKEAKKKIMDYVIACDTEITGFFDVDFDRERNVFVIENIYPLLEQEGSGAEVEMSAAGIETFNLALMDQGVTQLPRGWWHSHVNMGVFFSGTDREAMEDLTNETFNVSIVANKNKEMRCDVNLYRPMRHTFENVTIEVEDDEDVIEQAIFDEINEMVKKPSQAGRSIIIPPRGQTVHELTFPGDEGGFLQLTKKQKKLWNHYQKCTVMPAGNCVKCSKYLDINYSEANLIPSHAINTCEKLNCVECEENMRAMEEAYGRGN